MMSKGRIRTEQDILENCEQLEKDKPNPKASKWFKTPPYALREMHRGPGILKKEEVLHAQHGQEPPERTKELAAPEKEEIGGGYAGNDE